MLHTICRQHAQRHSLHPFLQEFGFEPHPVEFRIAFGTGANAWTNHSDSALVQRLQPEIERFGRVLRWVHRLEPLFAFIPINKVGAPQLAAGRSMCWQHPRQ